jgi:hypothetical protein
MRNGKKKDAPRQHGYPRPQMEREGWTNLNGKWDFAIDESGLAERAGQVQWGGKINVPFSPETPLSGVHDTGLYKAVWYRRTIDAPKLDAGQRLLLHFGAVDYEATVWVNDHLAVRHEGGYTPFTADITDLVDGPGTQTLTVRAFDDPEDLAKPRGKQDWRLEPHSIWYYRTTGIWQTVWTEVVPAVHIANLRWTADAENWDVGFEVRIGGRITDGMRLRVGLSLGERVLSDDIFSVTGAEVSRRIGIPDPGIDDYRNELLWSPEWPKVIDARVELLDGQGDVVDRVKSYTALRSIALLGNRFVLNGKPYTLRMALDQGYWEDGGLTAPDDEALERDVKLAKSMGFNGVRKHQKIEDPRYLYWADRLGLLVWEEMPSALRFTKQTVERVPPQWTEAILRDVSHPCVIAWVPLNESWGVPDLPSSAAQRNFVQALYHLTKTLDPSRPVIGNDGWEAVATDVVTIHDYDSDPDRIKQRYASAGEGVASLLREERPGHKVLTLGEFSYENQPIMLTEFGGIAYSPDPSRTWGYSRVRNAQEFARRYYQLLSAVRCLSLLAGFCYTQFADTYQEANGLLYMDRRPKFPLHEIAVATRGAISPEDQRVEATWRGTVMGTQRRSRAPREVHADR